MTILDGDTQRRAFRWVMLLLCIAAALAFVPLWAPLVLAAWVAVVSRPLHARASRITGGRHRAAGALVVLLVMLILVPVGIAVATLATSAASLARTVMGSKGAKSALVAIVSGGKPTDDLVATPSKIFSLVQDYGAQAASIAADVAGAATAALLGVFIFVYAVYVFLVDGATYYRWLEDHAPIAREHARRFAHAFEETGRGLFVSVGLTGLVQGLLATITYFALGVPRALALGLLTCGASLIPSFGTALVWVPVAGGLALAGRVPSAAIMGIVGVFVIGTVDNVLRPVFARFGKLELPTFVLLTSIFGGLAMFGTWGILLGPLFARLAKEALVIAREKPE